MLRVASICSFVLLGACSPERQDVPVDACASGCDAPPVCAPGATHVCVGNDLHVCDNGLLGPISYQCASCLDGACEFQPCSGAAKRLYVLTSLGGIRSYDPDATPAFGDAHEPSCMTGSPFAMTIDRLGRAWMELTDPMSASLHLVDPDHGYCESLGFDAAASGFERFSLTFVADGDTDHLLLAGASTAAFASHDTRLATVDTTTWQVTELGALPGSPEITGTSENRLFGYFPFHAPPQVAEIDPRDATILSTWDLPAQTDMVVAWAAAYWNGQVIVFDSRATSSLGARRNRIFSVDPKTGTVTTIDDDSPHVVTGAGVSTCFQVVN